MTRTFKAHFDGRVLIPDEPVNLPIGVRLTLTVSALSQRPPVLADPNPTIEERLAILERTFSLGGSGANLPDESLRRENIYGDDGR